MGYPRLFQHTYKYTFISHFVSFSFHFANLWSTICFGHKCSQRDWGGSWSSTRNALVPVSLMSQYLTAHWIFSMDRECVSWKSISKREKFKILSKIFLYALYVCELPWWSVIFFYLVHLKIIFKYLCLTVLVQIYLTDLLKIFTF